MRAFPDGHTGDALMALWFAYSEIRELLGTRVLTPKSLTSTIKDSPELKTKEQRIVFEKEADVEIIRAQERQRSSVPRMIDVFSNKK